MQDTDSSGAFYDIGRLRTDLRSVLEPLHYRNLDEVTELAGTNTTVETLARYILRKLDPDLRAAGVEGLKLTVWESSSSFASYREHSTPERPGQFCSFLIAARMRLNNSSPFPWCHRQTTTRSCSGSIQIVLVPFPIAAKLVAGADGHFFFCVLSHHR